MNNDGRPLIYHEYISSACNIDEMCADGKILKGALKTFGRGQRGTVFCNGMVIDLPNRFCVNRAINGDVVGVRLFRAEVAEKDGFKDTLSKMDQNFDESLL